jgi:uncharacterized protein YwqG
LWGDKPEDRGGWRLYLFPKQNLTRIGVPEGAELFFECRTILSLEPDFNWYECTEDLHISDEVYEALGQFLSESPRNHLLGHGRVAEDPGGSGWPFDHEEMFAGEPEIPEDFTLLFRLDGSEAGMMWSDGWLQFFIPTTDLALVGFRRVWASITTT